MNRIFVAGSVALAFAGILAAGMVESQAARKKPIRFQNEKDLIVTLVTPTLNQEVLPDLSDPGVNGVVTVHFSSPLKRRDVINNQNTFNRLTARFEFFDSSFARLPGTPRVQRSRFTFNPRTEQNGGVLAQGQYTLNVKRNVRNRRGRLLNFGLRDFTTTFSVGTDVYRPVLRRISPINAQTNIGLNQRVVATFNEPLDPSSIISSVQVQDASTNPPSAIPGSGGGNGVSLERQGFDLVFTPDPCFGYPPQTTIQFLMQGENAANTASAVTDVFGNAFIRDAGLQWSFNAAAGVWQSPNGSFDDNTGIFRTQFRTKGIKPRPIGLSPGSPQFPDLRPFGIPISSPCSVQLYFAPSCWLSGRAFMYTTARGIGEVTLTPFINRFNQGIVDFSLVSVVANSPERIGRPSGLVTDPRFDVNTYSGTGVHTFIYVVDQRTASVAVLDSRNLQVLGRFTGFSSPRDVTIATDLSQSRTTMYVSEFAANQMVALDLATIAVRLIGGQPGAPSVCESLKDQQSHRTIIETGRGPTGIAADSLLLNRVATANTLDGSITVVNVRDNSVRGTHETGSNPVDLDWTINGFGGIDMALVANQGGLNDPDGSISLYLRANTGGPRAGAAQTRDGIDASITDKIKNPTAIWANQQWLNPFTGTASPLVWYASNTGGKTVAQMTFSVTGLFGIAITPNITKEFEVGFNPSGAMLDPYYPMAFLFAAVQGTGQLAGMDPARQLPPTLTRVPGIRKLATCFSH